MGEVYRARDTRLPRTVAIKILPRAVRAHPDRQARFAREAHAISQLTHPHICTLFDVGQDGDIDFLVMEYLEGETLAARLRRGALPMDQALRVATEIATALDAAHRHGVVHRDLKPGNVMLTKGGAKLLDFGLAKLRAAEGTADVAVAAPTQDASLSATGVVLGTLPYMAPEQLHGQEADARTDLFAFGAVVYEMATGKRAFEGTSEASLIAAILEHDPPPIAATQPLAPPALDHVVSMCLAKDPDDRWQSASDVTHELKWIAESGAASAPPRVARRAIWLERIAWTVALAATIVAALVLRPARIEPPEIRFEIVTPPTRSTGIAISPDGRSVAYSAINQGRGQVWVRNLQSSDARLLATFDRANVSPLFYQPGGRSLVVNEAAVLKEVSLADGSVHTMSNQVGGVIGVSWNADGVILFAPANAAPLYRMPASGGPREEATRVVPPLIGHRYPSFLPDGRHFIFLAVGPPAEQGIYIGELGSKESRRLAAADTAAVWVPAGFIVYGRQDALYAQRVNEKTLQSEGEPFFVADHPQQNWSNFGSIALAASRSGTLAYRRAISFKHQLQWLDRSGRLIGAVGGVDTEEFIGMSRISPDGHTIATIRRVNGNADVWTVDNTPQSAPVRLTSNEATELGVVWSGDGSRLVFSSSRQGGGLYDLYLKTLGAADPEATLIASPENKIALDWSRDNRFLLYSLQGHEQVARNIWAMPMQGDRQPFQVTTAVPGDAINARFSPNGRWIAFQVNEPGGAPDIYVQRFPGPGRRWRISMAGGVNPAWTHDGREIIYVGPESRVIAVPITPSADGAFLDHGPPTALFSVRPGSTVEPAPDSDKFLVNVVLEAPAPTPITVILNWLKK